jgi:hypothetical protein
MSVRCQCFRTAEDLFAQPEFMTLKESNVKLITMPTLVITSGWRNNILQIFPDAANECNISSRVCTEPTSYLWNHRHTGLRRSQFNDYIHCQNTEEVLYMPTRHTLKYVPYCDCEFATVQCKCTHPPYQLLKKQRAFWGKWMKKLNTHSVQTMRRVVFDMIVRMRNSSPCMHTALCKDVCMLIYRQVFVITC